MSQQLEHTIGWAPPGANETRFQAIVTFGGQDCNVPYVRETATIRIHSAVGLRIALGAIVHLCGRPWVVCETKRRPGRGWATLDAVHMRPESWGPAFWSGETVICEPQVVPGLAATTREVEVARGPVVIAPVRPVRDNYDQAAETTTRLKAFLDRSLAMKLKQGWSFHNGQSRWRLDAVADLDRIDRLPSATVTETGFR